MFTNEESLDEDVSTIRNQLRLTEISLLSVGEQLSHSGGHDSLDERYDQQTWKHSDGLTGLLRVEDLQRPDVLSLSSDLCLERTTSLTADTRACSSLHNSRSVSGRSRSGEAVMEPAPLKKKLGFLRQENTCLSMQNQQLISDLKQAQLELATSQSKIRALGSTVGIKTTNVTVMREQLVALEAEVEDQAKELREAQMRTEKSQQTAALSDGQLIQLRDQLCMLQTELAEKTRLGKRAEQQRNLALVNAEKLQEAFKEYKANISIKLKKVMEDENNLKETLIECDREREELESKCVTLEGQHADQCEVISHLQEEAVQARTLTAERSDLQTRLDEAGRRVSSLERELCERAAEARDTGALRRELEDLRALTESLEDRVTQSQREAQQSQAELASLEAVVALLHLREGNDVQLCVKPCALPLVDNAGTTQLLKPKPGGGYQQLLPILQTFEAERARQSSLTQRLQERLSRAQEEISSLQNSMAQRASHFQDLHSDLLEKMSQAGDTEKELKRKSARVSALEKQLREKTSAYTQAGQRNTELEKLLMEKTSSIEHYQSLVSKKQKEFQQALSRADKDHAVECQKVQDTLEMLELSLEQAKERGLDLDQEVTSAQRDREDAMTLALSLQASLDQLTQEKEAEVQHAQKALVILKEQAAKSESKVHELEECLCQCEKELNCCVVQTENTKQQYKSQLEAMNNQLSSLQESLANATVLQRASTEQNLRLQVTLQQQQGMLQEGERRVAELEENQSVLQTQVSGLEQELERTRTSLQEELVRREKELEEAQCDAVEMNSRTSQLSRSVTQLTSEMSKCRGELSSMEKELQGLRQEASSKSLTISRLEQSLLHAQKLLDKRSDMVLDLEEKLHRSEADRRDLVQQAQVVDGQLQAVRGELSGTLKHLEDLRDMLERTQFTADQRQLSLEKVSAELRQSQRELEDRTHEVLDLDTALKERQGELQQRAQLLSQLDVAIKDHKLEMEKKVASLQDVLGTREKELRDRDQKLIDQDKKVEFLNERIDVLKTQVKENTLKEKDVEEQVLQLRVCRETLQRAAVDLQDTRSRNENLARELDTLGQTVEKKEVQLCAMEKELTGSEALRAQEKAMLLDTITSLQQEQEQEREQHSVELSSLQQTRGQLLKVSEQISSSMKVSQEHLVSKLEETQSQLDLVRAQYDQSQNQAEQFQLQLEQTRTQSVLLQLQLEESQNQAEQFQVQLEQTRTQSGQFQLQLEETRNQAEQTQSQAGQYKHQQEQFRTQAGQLQAQLEQTRKQAEQSQVQLEQTRSQAGQYMHQLEQSRTQAGQLQVQLERTRTQSSQLQVQLDQTRAQSGQTQLELEQAQTQASLLGVQLEQVSARLDQSKNQEALLQAQLLSAVRALQSSNEAIVIKESEVTRLQARISSLERASVLHHSTGPTSPLPPRTRSPPLTLYAHSCSVPATHDSVRSPQRDPTFSRSPKRARPPTVQLVTPPRRQAAYLPSPPPPAAHALSLPHLGRRQATSDWLEAPERMRELSVESSLDLSPSLKATLRDALAQTQHLPWDSSSPSSLSHYLPAGLQGEASPDHSWQGLSQVKDTVATDLSFNPLTYMVEKLGEPEEEEDEEGGLPQRAVRLEEERDIRRESVPGQASGGGGGRAEGGVSSLSGMLRFVNQTLAMQEDTSLWSSTPLSESPDPTPLPGCSQVSGRSEGSHET